MFIPAISSFQSTCNTKLPEDILCHVIMPSLIILSAPDYQTLPSHGPPFVHYFHTFCTKGILLCNQYEISSNLFLKLVPGTTYQGLRTLFQISFFKSTAKFYPSHTFHFSHIHSFACILLCFHSFPVSFSSFALYSFGSTASEMLTTLLSPTFLSNASSLFLKLFLLSSRSSHN